MDINVLTWEGLAFMGGSALFFGGLTFVVLRHRRSSRLRRFSETPSDSPRGLPNIPRPINAPPLRIAPPPKVNYSAPPCPQCGLGHLALDFNDLKPEGWRCRDCSHRWPFDHLHVTWEEKSR